MTKETSMKKEISEKIKKMHLSELHSRLSEIERIFKSGEKGVIDQLIPLSEEANLLKEESDKRIGNLESYFEEKGRQ